MKHTQHDDGESVGHPLLKAAGLADSVGFQLKLAQAAVWADLVAALAPFGLRPSHYSALLILRATPGSRQQDIGEALGIQRPNLVAMIDGLEKRGLLTRTVNPADRRSYALALTPDGAVLLDEAGCGTPRARGAAVRADGRWRGAAAGAAARDADRAGLTAPARLAASLSVILTKVRIQKPNARLSTSGVRLDADFCQHDDLATVISASPAPPLPATPAAASVRAPSAAPPCR